MPVELVSMEQATAFDRLRLVLVGDDKTGKSRIAATARKSILFFDFDGRAASLAGMKGVYAASLIDPAKAEVQPSALSDGLDILAKLEEKRSLTHIGFKNVPPEEDFIATAVVDSVYSLSKAARAFAMFTTKDLRREIRLGGKMTIYLPNGWDSWNADIISVEQFIGRLLAIPKLDVIVIFHETAEEHPDSTSEKRKYTGRKTIYPDRFTNLNKYFNEVWRVTRQDKNAPRVQVIPDYTFQAATNLGIEVVNDPNIEHLISDYIQRGGKPVTASAPAQLPASVGVVTPNQQSSPNGVTTSPSVPTLRRPSGIKTT